MPIELLHCVCYDVTQETEESVQVPHLPYQRAEADPRFAKAISDVGWGEFVSQLAYKADWYGRALVKIDKWYPSSKRCSHCGHMLASLDVRAWTCPECGTHHDRDLNAARNVHAAGLAVYACGEAVRPGAVKTTPGAPRRSRKAAQR